MSEKIQLNKKCRGKKCQFGRCPARVGEEHKHSAVNP